MLNILKDVITSISFEPNLVSDADDIGIIQKRIIQNIYNNEIIVCDVSAKNPNVMFELGMRLAFDKPTIIIKDDRTDYTFDTSIIEHLSYPRDLRFTKIIEFKENLKKKIQGTYKKAQEDPNYSTFLKNFGQYKIAHLAETEVSSNQFILSSLTEIKSEINKLKTNTSNPQTPVGISSLAKIRQKIEDSNRVELNRLIDEQVLKFAKENGITNINEDTLGKYVPQIVENIIMKAPNLNIDSDFTKKELSNMIYHNLLPF